MGILVSSLAHTFGCCCIYCVGSSSVRQLPKVSYTSICRRTEVDTHAFYCTAFLFSLFQNLSFGCQGQTLLLCVQKSFHLKDGSQIVFKERLCAFSSCLLSSWGSKQPLSHNLVLCYRQWQTRQKSALCSHTEWEELTTQCLMAYVIFLNILMPL